MTRAGRTEAIGSLFHPRNVVLVGASDRAGHWSVRVRDTLLRFGYPGHIFPVNPNRQEIFGGPCYPTVAALPEAPDHLAIFTPAETTVRLLEDAGQAGARSATLYAAGFGEGADAEGQRRGAQLRDVIARTNIIVVGPTCMGVACGAARFATIPDETLQPLEAGPVAVVVQSGAMCASINRAINDLGLKVAYMASCGSQIGTAVADFVAYFAEQPGLRAILCYIEAVPDAGAFLEAARRARQNGKVVVVVKIGGSEAARASALAHTGSLAGRAEVFAAYARSAGIVQFDSFEEAIEAVEFAARAPIPRGGNIAIMTNSGALRGLALEAAERTGARLAALSVETTAALSAALDQTDIGNPLDTRLTLPTAKYTACLDAFIAAEEIDVLLAAEELPLEAGVERRVNNLRALGDGAHRAAAAGKAVAMFTPLPVSLTAYGRTIRSKLPHVPMLRGTERTLRVVSTLAAAASHPLHEGPFGAAPAHSSAAAPWRERAASLKEPTALNEFESKAILRAYGLPVPEERLARTAAEAVEAARSLGGAVVLKAVSPALPHKSDAGLVALNVRGDEAVTRTFGELSERAGKLGARLDGILVAQFLPGGIETVLGIQQDIEMGPAVMFGMGGTLVELIKDVSFAPAYLDTATARRMIGTTRAGRMLDGFRGQHGDIDAVCRALVALGRMACDLSDVVEAVDVNPFSVHPAGAFALDALVVLRPPAFVRGDHP